MGRTDLAIGFALGAALLLAVGDVWHQRSARTAGDDASGDAALLGALLRDRRWWFGSAVSALGFAFQAAALGLGSVLLVQALMVTSLLFALPLGARLARRRITAGQWVAAVGLAGAVAVVVTVGNPTEGAARGTAAAWSVASAVMVPTLVLCVVAARRRRGTPAAVALAAVSGGLWGLFAVLMKAVVDRLDDGVVALLATPELYAWAAVAIAATTTQQSSFAAGPLTASLPTMTVAEPVVGSALGVAVLGETLRPGEGGAAVLAVAVAVLVAATVVLARDGAAATGSAVGPGSAPKEAPTL